VSELSVVLHEISVAFGCSNNLRTLTLRLADSMARHLPIAEIETVRLIEHRDEVGISAFAPGNCRRWEGRRSARFLERQGVVAPMLVKDELARVALAPVAVKLKLPVARRGIVSIAFETDISVILGSQESTDMLVDVLGLHCLRLGQLLTAGARCRAGVHRRVGVEKPVRMTGHRNTSTDMPVVSIPPSNKASSASEAPAATDIPVETIQAAQIRCIRSALAHTRGKIYGRGGAAELLGLKPSTLQSKMLKLGIERSDFAH
jgi:hypothetical protein